MQLPLGSFAGFVGGAAYGAVLGDNFTLTPQELTVASLVMGFLTAVTVAIIAAVAGKNGRYNVEEDPTEEWVLKRLGTLEQENEVLRERLWQHERGGPGSPDADR